MKRSALILGGGPERERLRELVRMLEERRDAIGELDLAIEMLREQLGSFEVAYRSRLASEHALLKRIASYVRVLDGWANLLSRRPGKNVASEGARVDERRARDVKQSTTQKKKAPLRAEVVDLTDKLPESTATSREGELKAIYRRLARRYHPDLARTEDERLQAGHMMARINNLYRARDLERLAALEEQTKGGELDDDDLHIEEQIALLESRLEWFTAVLANLEEERMALENSATCQLFRNVEQAAAVGRDLVEELRIELESRVQRAYGDISDAALRLERHVSSYNRDGTSQEVAARDTAVLRLFDPYADKSLVRLGLDELATARVSKSARERADRIEAMADVEPTLLRLVLMTYAADQSPFPLAGLASYEHIAQRIAYLEEEVPGEGAALRGFEEALVELDTFVQFGVKSANEKVAYAGLRFVDQEGRTAVAVALQRAKVRREMANVLTVLGDHVACEACKREVYAVPLYKTRGLDDLRASVCPRCGTTLSSYWMPKGKDVQAVLNPTYLDYELVSEWSFSLAHLSVAMQLLPVQVEKMTVGELKKRFFEDTFERHQIEVTRGQVALYQGDRKVPERTRLAELDERGFTVRFEDTKLRERDALELIRHRIRNRFK
ncbi:MAG TPA: hypothetical protein VLC93_09465 [Myxococcota bacterium]|nr:hypothetical protein [Myxococcota bacterium]